MKHLSILLAFLVALSAPVAAQDLDKGLAAYNAGDWATALQEWTPLAEAGDTNAQNGLGVMYNYGEGVPQDYKEAVKWYTLAAEQGEADAQFNLGLMYKNGNGVPQNYKETVKWYTLAAEQGDRWAQYDLGNVFRDGIQDNTMAHMWFNIASANGARIGSTSRDTIAKTMTLAAIEKAQAMASECMSSDYKKCGY